MKTVKITDEEYQEYQLLKSSSDYRFVRSSIDSITKLEDDIDTPIKNCVASFALLECRPIWSCCGFDYQGQPPHKFHQYGRCYFILGNPVKTLGIIMSATNGRLPSIGFWEFSFRYGNLDMHCEFKNHISQWNNKSSIHYSEQAVQYICELERFLMSMNDEFSDSAEITDTNRQYSIAYKNWQYPPREPWTVTKEWLIRNTNGNRNT